MEKERLSDKQRGFIYISAITLFTILMLLGIDKCSRDLDRSISENDFPLEYYQSCELEKQLRDAGMDDLADIEKADRKRKLNDGTYSLQRKTR